MITILRRLRQHFLTSNKFSKYLLYAIGEIILVVLGIVIALQLNNWNDERKMNASFDNLLLSLEDELNSNIQECSYEIFWGLTYIERYDLITSDSITRDVYRENPQLRDLIGANQLDIISEDINSLINKQDEFPSKYKPLIPSLKKFLTIISRYENSVRNISDVVKSYRSYITQNTTWMGDRDLTVKESEAMEAQIDFYMNDPVYMNFLSNHSYFYEESIRNMIGIRAVCLVLLAQVKQIRDHLSPDEIQGLLVSNNMIHFESYDCSQSPEERMPVVPFETYYPFINSSEQDIVLHWIDDQEHNVLVRAGEMVVNSVTHRIYDQDIIEVRIDGECAQKYRTAIDGFLLFR